MSSLTAPFNCRNVGLTEDLVRAHLSLKWNPFHPAVVAKY
jgi:hypothetical protein